MSGVLKKPIDPDRRYSPEELRELLAYGEVRAPRGTVLRHVTSRELYEVQLVSLRESDLEPLVTYSSVKNPSIRFSRDLREVRVKFVPMTPGQWEDPPK